MPQLIDVYTDKYEYQLIDVYTDKYECLSSLMYTQISMNASAH